MTRNSSRKISEKTKLKMDPLVLPSTLQEILMAPWADPVQSFFDSFEGFVYDPDAAPAALFNELAREQGWLLGTREHKQALERLQEAQFRRFDPSYGNAENTTEFNEYDDEEELTPAEWAFISDYKNPPQGDDPTAIQTLDQQIAEMSLESTVGHLDAFFAKYPGFERARKESVSTQLNKLRRHERWFGERRHLWDDALQEYQMALVQEFNTIFGTDENNLKNWHRLLSRVPGASLPGTIDECKSEARAFNVNLVDLVEADGEEKKVIIFDDSSALDSYTERTRKYFPRKHASAGGLLSYLLQHRDG